ncbi:MAG: hypothetical protein EOS27_32730 [Mesorhizobium sp.]|nr:MAG: hypothetical protein EOS27_32730 [Mesorhizobium sp.]
MKPRLANPALADRGARLAGVGFTDRLVPRRVGALPTAQPTSRACAEPAAPSDSSPDGAVFCHFTESLSVGAEPSVGRTIVLDDHSMILLRAVADYEQCSNEHAAALALAVYATRIGLGPLARAVLDERERIAGDAGGTAPLSVLPDISPTRGEIANHLAEDLHDLPDFERRHRFSRAREALRDNQGMRR